MDPCSDPAGLLIIRNRISMYFNCSRGRAHTIGERLLPGRGCSRPKTWMQKDPHARPQLSRQRGIRWLGSLPESCCQIGGVNTRLDRLEVWCCLRELRMSHHDSWRKFIHTLRRKALEEAPLGASITVFFALLLGGGGGEERNPNQLSLFPHTLRTRLPESLITPFSQSWTFSNELRKMQAFF